MGSSIAEGRHHISSYFVHSVYMQLRQRFSKEYCVCVVAFMWNQSPLALSAQGPYTLLFSEIVIDGQDLGVNKNPIPTNNKINLSLTPSFSFPFPSLAACMHICSHAHKYKSYLGPLVSKEDYICPLGLFFCAVQQSRARELAVSPGLKPALSTSIRG